MSTVITGVGSIQQKWLVQCCKKGDEKEKESGKKFGTKFRDGCTAVVSPGVGVWGVGGFPGFQGGFQGLPLPSRSTNLLSVPSP